MTDYVAPGALVQAFTCPYCGAFAQQSWSRLNTTTGRDPSVSLYLSRCAYCDGEAIWKDQRMIEPSARTGPKPHDQMPADVKALYVEAAEIGGRSPRSAAALLRLALQTLVDELESGAGDINAKIGRLVKAGLDPQVQQAMDVVRVVGNNAVHPGELVVDDDPDLVPAMFELVNLIVEQVIARPKKLGALFALLPGRAKEGIARRDSEGPVTKA